MDGMNNVDRDGDNTSDPDSDWADFATREGLK
jgi:hypothetical protein